MKRTALVVFQVIILLAFGSSLALAAEPAPWLQDGVPRQPTDDEVNAVAKQLYCPVCENIPLDVCPTLACEQWRSLIREKLAAGWSEEEIKTYFVNQYGDRVLATPPTRGLNWLVYIIPPAAILAGAFILFRALRAWRKPVEGVESETPALAEAGIPDEYTARLEDELRKHQAGSSTVKRDEL
ncbi:MAG TPA: cytochrome c-type biogenesis protein [Anaerolineales bacterium]|nr:cytochrome c-type biogenesis protein [Anaerolineales bacterium]